MKEDIHECDFQGIRDFCYDRAFGEEVEKPFADRVRKGCYEDTESDHLGREEKEGKSITLVVK